MHRLGVNLLCRKPSVISHCWSVPLAESSQANSCNTSPFSVPGAPRTSMQRPAACTFRKKPPLKFHNCKCGSLSLQSWMESSVSLLPGLPSTHFLESKFRMKTRSASEPFSTRKATRSARQTRIMAMSARQLLRQLWGRKCCMCSHCSRWSSARLTGWRSRCQGQRHGWKKKGREPQGWNQTTSIKRGCNSNRTLGLRTNKNWEKLAAIDRKWTGSHRSHRSAHISHNCQPQRKRDLERLYPWYAVFLRSAWPGSNYWVFAPIGNVRRGCSS